MTEHNIQFRKWQHSFQNLKHGEVLLFVFVLIHFFSIISGTLLNFATIMLSSSSGHYGLFEAIRYKRLRQAMLLAEAGIDVDCRNERGQTPLIYTVIAVDDCDRSRTKLVKLFLEAGADPNAADWKGMTALMHAASRGMVDTVKPLLECVRILLLFFLNQLLIIKMSEW